MNYIIFSLSVDAWWVSQTQFWVEPAVLPDLTEKPDDLSNWHYEEDGMIQRITSVAFLRESTVDPTIVRIYFDLSPVRELNVERHINRKKRIDKLL